MALPAPNNPGRRLSGLERTWLAADTFAPPFAISLVVEGKTEGKPIKQDDILAILPKLIAATPGMALRLRGFLGMTQWVSGPPPRVLVVDGTRWDGNTSRGAPFLEAPLDCWKGPTTEILVVTGEIPRIILRAHHAVTDGRGLARMADQLFRALRGEDLPYIGCGPLTDFELATKVTQLPQDKKTRGMDRPVPPDPPADRLAPTGDAHVFSTATTWARARIPGRHELPLARILRALVSVSHRAADAPLRVAIPVDMRRYEPDLASTANLTGILHLDLAGLPAGPDALKAIQDRITTGLPHSASVPIFAHKARNIPMFIMAREGKKRALTHLRANRYPISATLSNVGRIELKDWSTKGFLAQKAFFIPPGSPSMPMFLMFCGDDEGLELCASMPAGLADEDRLTNLLADLRTDLLVDNLRDIGRRGPPRIKR